MQRAKLFFDAFPSTLLIGANVLVFGSITLYSGNATEFETGLGPLLSLSGWLALFVAALLALPILILPDRICRRYIAVCACIGLLTWIQGNFLVFDYGLFDGERIDWEQSAWIVWAEVAIWSIVLAFGMFRWQIVGRYARNGAWTLVVCQAVVGAILLIPKVDLLTKSRRPRVEPPAEIYAYSENRNVIHVILDAYQTDVFLEVAEDPEIRDAFTGFTLFRGNAGVSVRTSPAMPAVFGGGVYDGSESFASFFEKSVSNGFPSRLHDAGYQVNLAPDVLMPSARADTVYVRPSQFRQSDQAVMRSDVATLWLAALFRFVPHPVKVVLFGERDGRGAMLNVSTGGVTRSLREKAFFKEYMEKIHVAIATPAYHFIHLLPPHPPFLTLPNGRYGGRVLPETRENYVNEARSITRLFVDFLRSLRDIGVYDSALIIVHGDHGFSFDPIVSGNALDLCLQRMPALMLVKPPGSAGPLDISDVQSSLTDIPATVLDTLGVDHDLPGKSVFDLMPGETRKRQLVVLPEGNLGNGLRRFELAGDVFDPAACTELERGMIDDTGSVFSPGREFGFGLLGQVNPYQQTGWATAGSTSTWTMGNQATLSMPVPAVTQDLNWSAEARGFIVPGKVTQQRVEIIANGLSVSNTLLQSSNLHRLSALIPAELLRSGRLDLVFRLPDATSRQEAGIQIDDKRRLAIEFMSMRMDEIPPILTGEAFPVGRRQSGLKYLTTGWGRSGDGYISIGSTARIRLPVVPTEFAGTLSLTLRAYIKPPVVAQQRLVGMINGTEVTTWSTDSGRVQVVELPISAAEMQTGRLDIELGLPDAVCPACVGSGGDERRRAIELLQFELQEAH